MYGILFYQRKKKLKGAFDWEGFYTVKNRCEIYSQRFGFILVLLKNGSWHLQKGSADRRMQAPCSGRCFH